MTAIVALALALWTTAPDGPAKMRDLVAAAIAQTQVRVVYDGSYRRIAYPGGDVPESIGMCTDVVIRAYRKVGIDLQVKVHEDMVRAFASYPRQWGMTAPDSNIDPADGFPTCLPRSHAQPADFRPFGCGVAVAPAARALQRSREAS